MNNVKNKKLSFLLSIKNWDKTEIYGYLFVYYGDRSPSKFGMCLILGQSLLLPLLHLFTKMGHFVILNVCKEVRSRIPFGNDFNEWQS
jgi:hypothetical protein